MNFLEKDLENIVEETLIHNFDFLSERGLDFLGFLGRPIIVKRQLRIGNYGIADIVTLHRTKDGIHILVWELKKGDINIGAVSQSYRYSRGIERYLRGRFSRDSVFNYVKVCRVVIGRDVYIDDEYCYLLNKFESTLLYEYCYDLDGLTFLEYIGTPFLKEEGF